MEAQGPALNLTVLATNPVHGALCWAPDVVQRMVLFSWEVGIPRHANLTPPVYLPWMGPRCMNSTPTEGVGLLLLCRGSPSPLLWVWPIGIWRGWYLKPWWSRCREPSLRWWADVYSQVQGAGVRSEVPLCIPAFSAPMYG